MADWNSERRDKRFRGARLCGALLGVIACTGASKLPPAKVTAVRFWSLGDATRVAVELTSEFHFRTDHLTNPDRLFFDIEGARPEIGVKGMYSVPVGDSLLRQIRVAETQPGVTRIVLDLNQKVVVSASQLSKPSRLMIELRVKDSNRSDPGKVDPGKSVPQDPPMVSASVAEGQRDPAPSESRSKPEPRAFVPPPPAPPRLLPAMPLVAAAPVVSAAAKPVRLLSMPLALPRVAPPPTKPESVDPPAPESPTVSLIASSGSAGSPALNSVAANMAAKPASISTPVATTLREPLPAKRATSGERSLTRALGLKLERVVLDPGHGGHDVGTHGPSGLYEKDVVLDVAERLGSLIASRLGSEVVYTRSDDTFIPLEERTQIANAHKADLFLSIHANSSPYRTAAGVETYVLNFTTSRTAMDLASRENASSQSSIYDLRELLQKIALRDKIDESREFAQRVQTSLSALSTRSNDGAKNRGIKRAPFVVLIGASMPSALAEIGFLSNASDEALLRKPEHREKIAEALFKGIASYADTLSHAQFARKN